MTAVIQLPSTVYDELRRHLLRGLGAKEEATFVFAPFDELAGTFSFVEAYHVPSKGFAVQLPYHFELTDATKAYVIKRAHDLGTSLIEFHSHSGPWPPQFSPSDWAGFEEVVPHVRWRLKGRPYAAVVMTVDGFDAFVWTDGSGKPARLDGIEIGGMLLEPSRLSPLERDGYDWTL